MAWILRRLPGAGLLREAWHATQLQGAIHEKKRAERALVLAEQNAQIGEFYISNYRAVVSWGAGGPLAPPEFWSSVNPFPTRGGRLCPSHYC